MKVKPKKHLGQHFLTDEIIAQKIVDALTIDSATHNILEIGPGTGVLTKYLLPKYSKKIHLIEIDAESVKYLKQNFSEVTERLYEYDFLQIDLKTIFREPTSIIGNFPYNISSQILFKVLENKDIVPQVVGMFQKEVAERICASPCNKSYGIISVFIQAFYHTEYLFTVNQDVFNPPPKVKSAVIRLTRNTIQKLNCDETRFVKMVKTAFAQRRKTLRNALKSVSFKQDFSIHPFSTKRAEELSVNDFIELTNITV